MKKCKVVIFERRAIITIKRNDFVYGLLLMLLLVNCMAIFDKDTTLVDGVTSIYLNILKYGVTGLAFLVQFLRVRSINLFCILPFIWWIVTHINSYENPSIGIVNFLALLTICITPNEEIYHVMKGYRFLMIIISLSSLVCYVSYILSGPIPYTVTDFYSINYGRRMGIYIDYIVNYIWVNNDGFARSCGFFNEPGFFGTILAFLLIMEKFNFKKKGNIVLLLAGLTTLSIGFLIICVIYLLLNSTKDYKKLIIETLFMIFILFILPTIHTGNKSINWVISRLSIIDGRLSGDNRTVAGYDQFFNNWKNSNNIWFGYGHGFSDYIQRVVNAGSASYKNYLLNYGIIGTFVSLGTLFALALKKTLYDRDCIIYLLVSFISLYQRPYVYNIFYFTFLFGGISYILCEKIATDYNIQSVED